MYYIGIDLGGTNIAAGIVDENGTIIKKESIPTDISGGYKKIVKDMAELSLELTKKTGFSIDDIKGVGIGTPGSVDCRSKTVLRSGNLKMEDAPIGEEFQKYWNIPVELENDASAAAYGEYVVNADNPKVFVAVTLGTGIGGGVIIDGEIFRGGSGKGTELGHILMVRDGIDCACGRKGCWERYASATALMQQIKDAITVNKGTLMEKLVKERGGIDGKIAFDAADMGDAVAKAVVKKYISYVADGILDIIYIFRPDKVVIGGGVSNSGKKLTNPLLEILSNNIFHMRDEFTKIETAKLKNDAGIVGAAMLARKMQK